jgi:hypothetical protein
MNEHILKHIRRLHWYVLVLGIFSVAIYAADVWDAQTPGRNLVILFMVLFYVAGVSLVSFFVWIAAKIFLKTKNH